MWIYVDISWLHMADPPYEYQWWCSLVNCDKCAVTRIWDKGQDWLRPNNKKHIETSKFEKEMLWLWQWKYEGYVSYVLCCTFFGSSITKIDQENPKYANQECCQKGRLRDCVHLNSVLQSTRLVRFRSFCPTSKKKWCHLPLCYILLQFCPYP
jgi:hypothetical protein